MFKKFFKFSNLSLFWEAFKEYRLHIVWLGVLSFTSGLLEGIGINAIIPLFSFADKNSIGELDAISKILKDIFIFIGINFNLTSIFIFILALFIFKTIVLFYVNELTYKITAQYERDSRLELFKLMTETDWPHLVQQKIGHLDQIMTTHIAHSSGLLSTVSFFILSVVNLLVYGLVITNISLTVAILVGVVGALLFFLLKPLFYKNNKNSEEVSEIYKQLSHYVNEHILGMKVIKSMFVEEEVVRNSIGHFDRMQRLSQGIYSVRNLTNSLLQPIGVMFILGIFALFYKSGNFNFGSFAVAVYAIQRLFSQIQIVQSQVHNFSSGLPYLDSVLKYKKGALKNKENNSGTKGFSFNNSLDFKGVKFFYNGSPEFISNMNFSFKKGEMLALIGPSGSGKTTVADLLLRLYRPSSGVITIDKEDIADIKMKEWRTKIGYVPQDPFMINDTIENNIKFYNNSIAYEDMIRAVKMANIYDFIEKQPNKFQATVGERGAFLSGGQRQRIVLARALARNPEILILDEATNSLDGESELFIQKAIENLKGKITILMIAHRLSTAMAADRLIALDGGKIIEEGNPKELLENKNSYFAKSYYINN